MIMIKSKSKYFRFTLKILTSGQEKFSNEVKKISKFTSL